MLLASPVIKKVTAFYRVHLNSQMDIQWSIGCQALSQNLCDQVMFTDQGLGPFKLSLTQ
jgi:hypothetical protein